jgi:hypothetical protein
MKNFRIRKLFLDRTAIKSNKAVSKVRTIENQVIPNLFRDLIYNAWDTETSSG